MKEDDVMNITKEQIKVLRKYMNNIDELVSNGNIDDLLIEVDDAIIDNYDKDYEPTEASREIQKIYDEIYLMN